MEYWIIYIIIIILILIACRVEYKRGFWQGRNSKIDVIEENNNEVLKEREHILHSIQEQKQRLKEIEDEYAAKRQLIQDAKENAAQEYKLNKELLNRKYQELEEELHGQYMVDQSIIQEQIDLLKNELDKIKRQKAAAIEAARHEKIIQENVDKYTIQCSEDEIHDIELLNKLKSKLFFPQVVGKIIWSTFIQKKIKQLCNDIVGTVPKTGIYKITNQLTQEAYIGQSTDISRRFSDHAKSGIGAVEVSLNNKLYANMKKYGLQNFSFEIIEECPREELNEKEKYYIQVYNTDKFGYNIMQGNA